MTEETTNTIALTTIIDVDVKAKFKAACNLNKQKMGPALEEAMQDYINKHLKLEETPETAEV